MTDSAARLVSFEAREPYAAAADASEDHALLTTLTTRLETFDGELDGLHDQIAGLAEDYGELMECIRRLQDELEQQGNTVRSMPEATRFNGLEQEIQELRAVTDELAVVDDDVARADDLNALAGRVERLEQAPKAPELNGALTAIEHWGNSPLAVLDRGGRHERYRRGDRVGAWRLESLDAKAGVAVFRHAAGHTKALAVED